MEDRILLNSIKCLKCEDVLVSKNRHDFVMCSCGKVGVDGGTEYLRRIGTPKDWYELSVHDDGKHETRRNTLRWGVNYDENMNRLPQTEWRLLKDLNSEHIHAIVDRGYVENNQFYKEIFKEELKFRKNDKKGAS